MSIIQEKEGNFTIYRNLPAICNPSNLNIAQKFKELPFQLLAYTQKLFTKGKNYTQSQMVQLPTVYRCLFNTFMCINKHLYHRYKQATGTPSTSNCPKKTPYNPPKKVIATLHKIYNR